MKSTFRTIDGIPTLTCYDYGKFEIISDVGSICLTKDLPVAESMRKRLPKSRNGAKAIHGWLKSMRIKFRKNGRHSSRITYRFGRYVKLIYEKETPSLD
jgi:hypothetical protein